MCVTNLRHNFIITTKIWSKFLNNLKNNTTSFAPFTIKMLKTTLVICLVQVLLLEATFTTKHFATQKVYSIYNEKKIDLVKSHFECCNRCINMLDCLGIKHHESTCTLVSELTPTIIEAEPTNALEDLLVDQEYQKYYKTYGLRSSK